MGAALSVEADLRSQRRRVFAVINYRFHLEPAFLPQLTIPIGLGQFVAVCIESILDNLQETLAIDPLAHLVEQWAATPQKPSAIGFSLVLACLAGMGTKEVMVSAPLMVLAYDACFLAGSWRQAWRQRTGYYTALAATWIPLAVLVALPARFSRRAPSVAK